MPKILIVGHGFVGKAVDYGFSHPKVEKTILDPIYNTSLDDLSVNEIKTYDAIFVCVPTPMGSTAILDDVMSKLPAQLVIVKSTVTPDVVKTWPSHVVYNPEFLTEKSANEQFVDPPFHILGGEQWATDKVETLYTQYSLCSHCPSYHMTGEEASFVKYSINTFLAMKVTFFNQLYDVIGEKNANFATIIKAIGADDRIGPSHTKVPGFDGKQGFGGACFPKDVSAFINYNKQLTLLKEAAIINNSYRQQYELDEREKQQHVNYGQIKEELKDQDYGYPV